MNDSQWKGRSRRAGKMEPVCSSKAAMHLRFSRNAGTHLVATFLQVPDKVLEPVLVAAYITADMEGQSLPVQVRLPGRQLVSYLCTRKDKKRG